MKNSEKWAKKFSDNQNKSCSPPPKKWSEEGLAMAFGMAAAGQAELLYDGLAAAIVMEPREKHGEECARRRR